MLESKTFDLPVPIKEAWPFLVDWVREKGYTLHNIAPSTHTVRYRWAEVDVTVDINKQPRGEGSLVLVKATSRRQKRNIGYYWTEAKASMALDTVELAFIQRFMPERMPPPKTAPTPLSGVQKVGLVVAALFFWVIVIGTLGTPKSPSSTPAPTSSPTAAPLLAAPPTAPKPAKKKKKPASQKVTTTPTSQP